MGGGKPRLYTARRTAAPAQAPAQPSRAPTTPLTSTTAQLWPPRGSSWAMRPASSPWFCWLKNAAGSSQLTKPANSPVSPGRLPGRANPNAAANATNASIHGGPSNCAADPSSSTAKNSGHGLERSGLGLTVKGLSEARHAELIGGLGLDGLWEGVRLLTVRV